MIGVEYSMGEAYQYDPAGNREVMTDTAVHTYAYDAANRLTNADGVVHTWDNRGNLLADGTFTYTYNAAGRMVRAESITATLVYTYNADGLRVAQSQSVASVESVDTFTWDWAMPVPELLSDGESLYLIGYDTLGWQNGMDWMFVLPDALGSVRQETDAAGAVTAVREWSPYGEEIGGAQTGLGFTGEWFDVAVGLTYLRARWYDGSMGRFTQKDSLDTEAFYRYANDNPIRHTDPTGFGPVDPWEPYDPGLCDADHGWRYPAKYYCDTIVNKSLPLWYRYQAMYVVYLEIIAGMELAPLVTGGSYSFEHAPEFWKHFLFGFSELGIGNYVELVGPEWGVWAWQHPYHKGMHFRQLGDFIAKEVVPAMQMNLPKVGPWRAGTTNYDYVPAGPANNDVSVAIGRHWIQGDFYADNIRCEQGRASADITIQRFIDDIFDFEGDNGSVPVPDIIGNKWGYGHVSHLWANELDKAPEALAKRYKIHIEWTEQFSVEGTTGY